MEQIKNNSITLVRYGELALKSTPVRRRFEDILVSNIRAGLRSVGLDYKVRKDFGRIFIEGYNKKMEPLMKRVFGIVSFSHCLKIETDLKKIKKECLRLAEKIKGKETFAVRCHRVGQHDFTSQDIERSVGAEVVKKFGLKVNLSKPDKTVHIEIRGDRTYVFSEVVPCAGGLPVGTAGKVACVIKDFNGVIAAWFFIKRGCCVVPITKSKKYLGALERWYVGRKLKPCAAKTSKELEEAIHKTRSEAVVTGETLSDFKETKLDIPVFRPLVGFDRKYLLRLRRIIENG